MYQILDWAFFLNSFRAVLDSEIIITTVIHLLQVMGLHWHIIVTQRSYFISGPTLGIVRFGQMYNDMHTYTITVSHRVVLLP